MTTPAPLGLGNALVGLVNEITSAIKPKAKTKNNKAKRNRPARKNKNKNKNKITTMSTRFNNTQTVPFYTAPAAVGGGLPRVYTESYTPSTRDTGTHVGLRGCCWLTDIVSDASGIPNFATSTIPWSINQFIATGGLTFGPIDPSVWRSPVSNVASAFTQYRTRRVQFHYCPTCPSTQPGQIVLAIAADVPSSAWSIQTVKTLEGSKSVAPWIPANIDGVVDNTWKYLYDTSITNRDDNRFADAGVIALAGTGAGTSGQLLGQLYVTFDFEFKGHAPEALLSDVKVVQTIDPPPTGRFFR